jgi:hypothetical protein
MMHIFDSNELAFVELKLSIAFTASSVTVAINIVDYLIWERNEE